MTAEPIEGTISRHVLDVLPCPSWCDGHPGGQGLHDSVEMSVTHAARTGWRLMATSPGQWTDWSGPVTVERLDTYSDGVVEIGTPTINLNVNELDCLQDVVDLAGDLLMAGLVLAEALR